MRFLVQRMLTLSTWVVDRPRVEDHASPSCSLPDLQQSGSAAAELSLSHAIFCIQRCSPEIKNKAHIVARKRLVENSDLRPLLPRRLCIAAPC